MKIELSPKLTIPKFQFIKKLKNFFSGKLKLQPNDSFEIGKVGQKSKFISDKNNIINYGPIIKRNYFPEKFNRMKFITDDETNLNRELPYKSNNIYSDGTLTQIQHKNWNNFSENIFHL